MSGSCHDEIRDREAADNYLREVSVFPRPKRTSFRKLVEEVTRAEEALREAKRRLRERLAEDEE